MDRDCASKPTEPQAEAKRDLTYTLSAPNCLKAEHTGLDSKSGIRFRGQPGSSELGTPEQQKPEVDSGSIRAPHNRCESAGRIADPAHRQLDGTALSRSSPHELPG